MSVQKVCANCDHAELDSVDLWCRKHDCPVFGNEKACPDFVFHVSNGQPVRFNKVWSAD